MKNRYMIAEHAYQKTKEILDRIERTNMKEEMKQPESDTCGKIVDTANKYNTYKQVPSPPQEDLHRKSILETIRFAPQTISEDDYLKVYSGQKAHTNILVRKCEELAQQITNMHSAILNDQRLISQLGEQLDSCRDTVKRQAEMLQKEAHLKDISYGAGIRYKQEVEKLHRTIRGLKSVISGRKNGNRPPKK